MRGVNYCEQGNYLEFEKVIKQLAVKNIFLVHGKSAENLLIYHELIKITEKEKIRLVEFDDFTPNPEYESVVRGVQLYLQKECKAIVAIGGGSALDVAKCIKVFANMDHKENYLIQEIHPIDVPFIAVPTTAGTGSEATSFAVIYYNGDKKSVQHTSCLPDYVFLDASVLSGIPDYQRKVTMLDALCHAVESYWSVNSTEESRYLSAKALTSILNYMDAYLNNISNANNQMLIAANLAGQAINITKTTAAHAMCYKLTSMFEVAHGQAAGICLPFVWKHMLSHMDKCADARGSKFVLKIFKEISACFGCDSAEEAIRKILYIYDNLALKQLAFCSEEQMEILIKSVNIDRLKNNPIVLDTTAIHDIYEAVFERGRR